jgi:tagaturonate epimerase
MGLDVYATSLVEAHRATWFLARRGDEKLVGAVGSVALDGKTVALLNNQPVRVGLTSAGNAGVVREMLPWTGPKLIGLATSVGLGDRLGSATPGHVRAMRGSGLAVALAQQSIREMTRTGRTPQQVMDAATWGVLQEGFDEGFGADADHLQHPADVDATAAAGFRFFTVDPGAHVARAADEMDAAALAAAFEALDFAAMETSPADLRAAYEGKAFALAGGGEVRFDDDVLVRAAVKYGTAVAHTLTMHRRIRDVVDGPFELEVSVDETESPTSTAEHYFIASELRRLGVPWVSLAPRFVGRFEKGVDYLGDLDAFRASFAQHAAVMRTLGPYKISIHSGSDKFSIYPVVAELTEGLVHVKTAGTSYLEALRAIARVQPSLFREILDFARERYETDKATYHVSADVTRVRPGGEIGDDYLPALLDDLHARQVLHVTYGSVLTAEAGERFARHIHAALSANEEAHYAALEAHLGRHVRPFCTAM